MGPHERAAVCSKCKNGEAKGTSPWCNACKAQYARQKRLSDPEFREREIAKCRAYYKANREKLLAEKSIYGKQVAERDKARRRDRYRTDPAFKARTNARTKQYYADKPHVFRARDAKRRADQLRATPQWADLNKIREFYAEARRLTKETGIPHEVDHIVPLKGRNVSGLHVHFNLRVVPRTVNRRKFNKTEDIVQPA